MTVFLRVPPSRRLYSLWTSLQLGKGSEIPTLHSMSDVLSLFSFSKKALRIRRDFYRAENSETSLIDLCWGQHLSKEKRQKSSQDHHYSSDTGLSCLKSPSAYPPLPVLFLFVNKLSPPYLFLETTDSLFIVKFISPLQKICSSDGKHTPLLL